jgi:hypothetical protein
MIPPGILTNEYTVAGGSYFPPGRTNWLATDYQWFPLTNILRSMVWAKGMIEWDTDYLWWGYGGCLVIQSNCWDVAVTYAETSWESQDWCELGCGPYQYSMGLCDWLYTPVELDAFIQSTCAKLTVLNMFTGICHSVDVYYKAKIPEGYSSYVGIDWYGDEYYEYDGDPFWGRDVKSGVFDDNGTANIYTNMTRIAQWPEGSYSESNILVGVLGDATNDPGIPVWCDPPPTNTPDYVYSARGWWSDKWKSVVKWDGPRVFQYK